MKQLRRYIRQILKDADPINEAPRDYTGSSGDYKEDMTSAIQADRGTITPPPIKRGDKQTGAPPGGEKGGKTVGQAFEEISAKEMKSKDAQRVGMLKKLGWEFIKLIPVAGAIPMFIEQLNDEKKIASDASPSAIKGLLLDYPLLDTWDINRELFKVIDNELLETLEDKYMTEEISKVTLETYISEMEDINDYIARKITEMTNGQIVVEIAK